MKALTNILTRLLMLMLLMLVACTEETAEVDNLTRQEQYVTVRMNIPGMTAATTRAADGAITSVTALSFNSSDQLLDVKTVNTINNVNANNGYNGNFNLTVPNGTQTIHFLANLPLNYSNEQTYVDFLKAKKGQSQVDVMTTLTTTDYNNLVYWGMATYDGSNSTLSTTLYRNMAKISIKPSVEDVEFNQFTQEQLIIMGLDNPNTSGTLIPYNNGFHNTGVAPTYLTLPNGVTTLDKTPVGNEGAGYGYSLYVFEHANSNYMDKGLFVFCKIGDAYYSVALTRDGINPYEIKRNHEYIIYVSDVDDYQTNDYRAESYDALFDGEGKTVKKPINLKVKEVESVTFNASAQSIDVDGNLTVTVDVPQDGTVTALTISAPGFTIKQGETILGNDGSYTGSDLTITGNNSVTYTFVPNTFGQGKEITFTASGTNLQETEQTISVNVTAAIYAGIENNSTLYYDQDNQTVTVNVTMPKGLSAISIGGADNFTVTTTAQGTFNNNVYTRAEATTTQEVQFVFTLDKSKYASQQGDTSATFTFSDASTENAADKATSASVDNISLIPTPEVTFSQSAQTIYLGGDPLTVNMTVPYGGTLNTLNITAEGFTIKQNGSELGTGSYNGTNLNYSNTQIKYTFTPTGTEAANRQITFTGSGTNIKEVNTTINVAVAKPAITANADKTTLYYDTDNQTITVNVKIPKGVSALGITATDFTMTQYDNNVGSYSNGIYTLNNTNSEQNVQFVFTMNNVSSTSGKTSTAIEFSDNAGVATSPNPITILLTEKPEEVTSLVVTSVGTTDIDLSESGNKKVKLTLSLPSTSGQIEILTNYMFKVTRIDEGMTQPQLNNGNYYYYNIDATTINLELELSDTHYLSTEGDYSITFNYNVDGSKESVTKTIKVVNSELEDGVIWKGEATVNWDPGLYISGATLKDYVEQTIAIDVKTAETGDTQIHCKVGQNTIYQSALDKGVSTTLNISISGDKDVLITGAGVTLLKIYIPETTE